MGTSDYSVPLNAWMDLGSSPFIVLGCREGTDRGLASVRTDGQCRDQIQKLRDLG